MTQGSEQRVHHVKRVIQAVDTRTLGIKVVDLVLKVLHRLLVWTPARDPLVPAVSAGQSGTKLSITRFSVCVVNLLEAVGTTFPDTNLLSLQHFLWILDLEESVLVAQQSNRHIGPLLEQVVVFIDDELAADRDLQQGIKLEVQQDEQG